MILEILFTSTVLIIGIFCLRKLTLGRISMRLRYALWLLAAVRLLVPFSFGTSAFSVMNLLPDTIQENFSIERENGGEQSLGNAWDLTHAGSMSDAGARSTGVESADAQGTPGDGIMPADHAEKMKLGAVVSEKAETGAVQREGSEAERAGVIGSGRISLFGVLWLLGFLAVGGYMLVSGQRFKRYLRCNRREVQTAEIPGFLARRLSGRGMKVYQVRGLPSPCLAGRHIYIREGALEQKQQLAHILAHEYCHALHGDGLWAFLRCLLAAVYWFDPFVWAAAYGARQDSELACDEAAVRLLGEPQRFAYGRTLLSFLRDGAEGREKCPGMPFMSEGGEHSVRERILALTKTGRRKRTVLAVVLAAVVLFCGCAFTGADREDGDLEKETGEQTAGVKGQGEAADATQSRQTGTEENDPESQRMQKEYEEAAEHEKLTEEQIREVEESAQQEAQWQAFAETLHYHGEMEGKDDSELMKNREFDVQSYYDWQDGKGGEKPKDGWYLLCREDGGLISLYGLYTETFGFRGLKVRIGEDVTTLDIPWCASYQNESGDNIRILEAAEDGWPRRFMWKLLAEESGQVEKWRLYEGFRYDTGTVDLKSLTEEDCVEWAREYLSFTIDQEAAKVHVAYDGDMYLGDIDISAYRDRKPEDVQIVPDTVGFALNGPGWEKPHSDSDEGSDQMYPDEVYEGTTVYLSAGLKLNGAEGLWFDGLPVLAVQAVEDENSDTGFRLEHPRIDESYVARALW